MIFLLLVAFAAAYCDTSNPNDTPPGCQYCNSSITQGYNGCEQNAQCYREASLNNTEICACPLPFAPPRCQTTLPVCDPLNATQAPPVCTFCDVTAPVGQQGCANGGECYYNPGPIPGFPPLPPPGLPICGCPFGKAPPTCLFDAPQVPLCNASNPADTPPNCYYCDPTAPVGSQGCENGGICYYERGPLPGFPPIPPPGLPICGCPFGFAPPSCTFRLPELPFCNTSNPADVPPNCNFCDPTKPQGEQGCANGGTCYIATSIPGFPPLPPTGLPLCGCSYDWAPPRCDRRSVPVRYCNATETPFDEGCVGCCQFCDPNQPIAEDSRNGCQNFGQCVLQDLSGEGIPPNFQLPICDCQTGPVPPQCRVDYLTFFGRPDLIPVRWAWVVAYVLVLLLSVLVICQHVYYAYNYKLTNSNLAKFIGALLIFGCAVASICSEAINPRGFVYGYPTAYDVISYAISVNILLCFLTIAVAINTGNWLWIGLAAVTPAFRGRDSWGWPSIALVTVVAVSELVLGLYFSIQQPYYLLGTSLYLYISAGFLFAMLIFSVISGAFVLLTISEIDTADPKLLRNTAVQLVIVCFFELIAAIILVVIIALPADTYSSGIEIFGVTTILPILVQCIFLTLLLVQFRIAQWQLKEVALTRHNTMTGNQSSSARNTAHSYNDEGAVSGSSYVEDQKPLKKKESEDVVEGVIEL